VKALINSTVQDVRQKEDRGYAGVQGKDPVDWSRYAQIGGSGMDAIALQNG
jgi:hypothetical protein